MKVKDLIKELQKYDLEKEVEIFADNAEFYPIKNIEEGFNNEEDGKEIIILFEAT